LLALAGFLNGNAQEYLIPFNAGETDENQKDRSEVYATLPFFDDFSTSYKYTDDSKWILNNAYVSANFPMLPVNYNAVTLDVADRYGKIYSRGSSTPFVADTLKSVKIRLDSLNNQLLTPADSLYFSFYYQPGGYGDCPERDDSLVLQFGYGYDVEVYDSVNQHYVIERHTKWQQMWATRGVELDTFLLTCGENQYFKKVMVPITDSCFFVEDFQVLFFNYGTLPTQIYPNDRSNMDMWNIDFVYLDKDRSIENDNYPLVSLTGTVPSFLKRYQSMPYKHYQDNPIAAISNDFDINMTNLDVNTHQVKYSCEVVDNNSSWSYNYQSNPMVINQYPNVGVKTEHVLMGDFIYPYNETFDTTSYTIRHYIEVVDEHSGEVRGDSIIRRQGFYNFFAYDDGTPEMGYGLVPADTYFASQFNVMRLDTLRGVQILFNRTHNDANYNFFDIVVWQDNNGKPGEIIYTLENQRPIWKDSIAYNFSYYRFNKLVKVNSVFYVGIRQRYNKTINIGFDSSIDNHQYNFYDVGEGWKNSAFLGSLMIRPIMGNKGYFIGVDENQEVTLDIYPNPAQNIVHIDGLDETTCHEILIYDITGRVVKRYPYCNELNVSELQNGVYMIRIVNHDDSFETYKLLISK
jgi:hypothetical protein